MATTDSTSTAYRLLLFDSARLLRGDGAIVAFPTKGLLLIARLLLGSSAHSASRPALARFLWEEAEGEAGLSNLRQLLLRLRMRQKQLGLNFILEEAGHVRVDATAVAVDVIEFQRLIDEGAAKNAAAVCDLYRGDFLADALIEGAECTTWLHAERARLKQSFAEALLRCIEQKRAEGDASAAALLAKRVLDIDPYQEAAARALMLAYAEGRRFMQARETYDRLRERLSRDLGERPEAQTEELARHLFRSDVVPAEARRPATGTGEADHGAKPQFPHWLPRLTILPPQPDAAGPELTQLAASLVEEVTIGLCSLKSFSILAPHSACRICGDPGLDDMLDRLAVDYAVDCRLSAVAGRQSFFVKLFRVRGREVLWAERYPFDLGSIATRYRELTTLISLSVVTEVERAELSRFASERDPKGYYHFLLGQRALGLTNLASIRRARKAFRAALDESPDFAPAVSGLARTYHREWLLTARGDMEMLATAERLASRAVGLDPNDARAHRELGVCRLFAGRFDDSIEALGRAEAESPNYADVIADLADALVHSSEPALGLEKIERAIELNPLCPDSYWWKAGGANFHLKRYEAAISCLSRMSDPSPAFRLIAACWGMLGEHAKAGIYVHKAKAIHPDFRVENWVSIIPSRDEWQQRHYEEGLRSAGFD